MKNRKCLIYGLITACIALLPAGCAGPEPKEIPVDRSDALKQSLVYLDITNSRYDQYQPWKMTPVAKEGGFGCVVAPGQVLTTAENVANATLIQVKTYSQNNYIPATVKVVDYECNLALLTLDQTAIRSPLKPIRFEPRYPEGKTLTTFWLSAGSHLTQARSTLDRAEMRFSDVSFAQNLNFRLTNISRPFGDGEVCFDGDVAIGMASWGVDTDAGAIAAETINRFLTSAKEESYTSFGQVGFQTFHLLDPTMRRFLKMPDEIEHGVYVSTVYQLGSGSTELRPGDVILSLDGHTLNPYGRYKHDQYDRISFENIILQKPDGAMIPAEIWRNGRRETLEIQARSFEAGQMLVPYYMYGKQPEYVILGGFVFQTLTRDYLTMWGEDWAGKVPPHLYHYYVDLSFKPSDDRKDIVVLNYVLPMESNLGYQQLSRLVVSTINGSPVQSIADLQAALYAKDQEFIVIEFETESPRLVLNRAAMATENLKVAQMYGIPSLVHIE
jgi:S1-C subfamily serine protease